MSDKNNNTFTLIELLTVLMIMGVMLAVAVPALQHNIPAAKQTAFRENVKQIVDALEVYRSRAYIAGEACYYPASLQELAGYFTQEPVNPYTGTSMLNSDSALSGIEYVRTENCNNYEIVVVQPQIDGFPIVSSITATVSHNNQVRGNILSFHKHCLRLQNRRHYVYICKLPRLDVLIICPKM